MHTLGKRIAALFLFDRLPIDRPRPSRSAIAHAHADRHNLRDALALANAARSLRARYPSGPGRAEQYSNQASI